MNAARKIYIVTSILVLIVTAVLVACLVPFPELLSFFVLLTLSGSVVPLAAVFPSPASGIPLSPASRGPPAATPSIPA